MRSLELKPNQQNEQILMNGAQQNRPCAGAYVLSAPAVALFDNYPADVMKYATNYKHSHNMIEDLCDMEERWLFRTYVSQ